MLPFMTNTSLPLLSESSGKDSDVVPAFRVLQSNESEAASSLSAVQPRSDFSFEASTRGLDISRFVHLLKSANLTEGYIDTCETPLTIFAPSDAAFVRLAEKLPSDMNTLRELLCVHIVLGSLSKEHLLKTRSVTTISQQTHHVLLPDEDGQAQELQVGSAQLRSCDHALPNGRGIVHVVDSVLCYIRVLQHCRYEQVWNKTVRPSPKLEVHGDWRSSTDELHAILIHSDSWQPRFGGLRGASVALQNQHANERNKFFQDGVIQFSELLILEKPPEMSKKKRKKKEDGADADDRDNSNSSNYRIMYSLYRRDSEEAPPPVAAGEQPATAAGKHLSFCMAAEDILIRNSFHMLSEAEKEARRTEYKALSDGSSRSKSGGSRRPPAIAQTQSPRKRPAMPLLLPPTTEVLTALLPPPPLEEAEVTPSALAPQLSALSVAVGHRAGGTTVWAQGQGFVAGMGISVGGQQAQRVQVVSDTLVTFQTPPLPSLPPGKSLVEVHAVVCGKSRSNALPFTVLPGLDTGGVASGEDSLMERQLSLLQHFVTSCCGAGAEMSVTQLMAPVSSQLHRLLGAVLALILAGSGGVQQQGSALDFERQDAWGCTLMHYVCASRNEAALQLLLRARVNPNIADNQGMNVGDWARAFHWAEGERLLTQAASPSTGAEPVNGFSFVPVAPKAAHARGAPTVGQRASAAGRPQQQQQQPQQRDPLLQQLERQQHLMQHLQPEAHQQTDHARQLQPAAMAPRSLSPLSRAALADAPLDSAPSAASRPRLPESKLRLSMMAEAPVSRAPSHAPRLSMSSLLGEPARDTEVQPPVHHRPSSLAHFLEPKPESPGIMRRGHQGSLAGFLTAAAAHVEATPSR